MNNYFAIKKVQPVEDFQLVLTFSNREKRVFDMKPYLKTGIFKELRNVAMFNTAHISFDTVTWNNEADFDPEVLYTHSKKIQGKKYSLPDSVLSVAAEPVVKYSKK